MKNKDIYDIKKVLEKWSDYKDKRISFVVFQNTQITDTLINTFNNLTLSSEDYEFKKEMICKKYSSDIINNEYIIKNKKDFNKEMDILDYNYIKANQLMNSNCVVKFYKIKLDELPENISANELKEISFMI